MLVFLFLLSQVDSVYRLTDFRLPQSGALEFWIEGGGGLNKTGSFDEDLGYFWIERFTNSQGGWIRLFISLDRQNERHDFSLYSRVDASGGLSNGEQRTYDMSLDSITYRMYRELHSYSGNSSSRTGEGVYLSEDWFYYPFKKVLFVGLDASFGADHDFYDDFSQRYHRYYNDSITSKSKRQLVSGYLGLYPQFGVGRLRPLEYPSRALAVAEILEDKPSFKNNPELVQKIAELYARRWEYPVKYWHPDWEFYEDMEELLAQYGVPPAEMGIRSWMRIIESSSVWDVWDYYYRGRPYGLRLSVSPTFQQSISRHFDKMTQTDYDSVSYAVEDLTKTYEFYFNSATVVLEGGYPLTKDLHLQGEMGFSPCLFYNYRWYKTESSTGYQQDTTIIDSLWKIKNYHAYYNTSLRYYIIYTLSITLKLSGGLEHYVDEDSLYHNSWGNGITLGTEYTYRNRFFTELSGGFNVHRSRITHEEPFWELSPKVRFSIGYRFF